MFDLYLVVTPLLALLSFLTLINLKLTLREPSLTQLQQYQKKITNQKITLNEKSSDRKQIQEKGFKKTLFYLIKNFTLLQLFIVRRARNKIPFLFSISLQILISIMFSFLFIFSSIGIVVTLFFILIKVITYQTEPEEIREKQSKIKKSQKTNKDGPKLQILITILSLFINMAFIWIVYKNYKNILLIETAFNLLITFSIDNFAAKPIILTLFAFPLSFSERFNTFIDKENQIIEILKEEKSLNSKNKADKVKTRPKKFFVSTSNTQNTIQIEPYVNLDPRQNVRSTLDVTKSLQLHKMAPLKKRSSQFYDGDSSLMGIFELNEKNRQPYVIQNKSLNLSLSQISNNLHSSPQTKKISEDLNNPSFLRKGSKLNTKKVDFIKQEQAQENAEPKRQHNFSNPRNQIQNEQEEDSYSLTKNLHTPLANRSLKQIKFINSGKSKLQKSNQKISNWTNPFSNDQICKSHERNQNRVIEQSNSNVSYGSNIFASGGKKELVKIYQDKFGEDLGEIDMNSPYRKRNNLDQNFKNEFQKSKKTNTHKKFSLDPTRSILEKSNTEQCHDLMQKTQNNQYGQTKKVRSFHQVSELCLSQKSDIFTRYSNDSRNAKSVKRTRTNKDPIVRQNDENCIPQFIIEDFPC